jgi:epoxyqueuosine reductase
MYTNYPVNASPSLNIKTSMNTSENTRFIKQASARAGFDYCGIARAEPLDDDARRLQNWLSQGMHGTMSYMEDHFDLRVNPLKLVPGAKSVITLLLNYYPDHKQAEGSPKISKYAYGKDYHLVIRTKLQQILREIRERIGEVQGRGFVDSAPVLERSWALKSGLGWIGKNGNLINKKSGSFFFIATLIVDLELIADDPFARDFCGSCRKCIDACPTNAILEDKVIDGSKCISYYTIELKELLIPDQVKGKFDDWLFGCDHCQVICPWNRFSRPTGESGFLPIAEVIEFNKGDWEELTEEGFKKIFRDSPLKRTKFAGIKRNLKFIRS